MLYKEFGDEIKALSVFGEDALCICISFIDNLLDFAVDDCRCFIGIIAFRAEISAEEYFIA